jgi:simple sugar transport system ATP-binding protein
MSNIVEMKNIHKFFGAVHALKGVNFNVRTGESVGLVGDNGAGKSTLIKILTGVIRADKGEIYYQGKKVQFKSPREARMAGIETIYQEDTLAEDLPVFRNMFLGRELVRRLGFINILDDNKMKIESKTFTESIGLKLGSIEQRTRYCSGGEKAGIALARALLFNAKLIIMDEPFRALSPVGVQETVNRISRLREKNKDLSIIFVTHNLYQAFLLVDRIVVLIRGEIVADLPKERTSIERVTEILARGAGVSGVRGEVGG